MLTRMADAAAAGRDAFVAAGARDDLRGPAQLELSHRICLAGGAVVDIGGELDTATADLAVRYVRQVIDRRRGPVTVDLAVLGFCDAAGLGALLRMAGYAEQAGCPFRLVSPQPSLVKIMRITGLDRTLLAPQAAARLNPAGAPSGDRVPGGRCAGLLLSTRPGRPCAGQRYGTSLMAASRSPIAAQNLWGSVTRSWPA